MDDSTITGDVVAPAGSIMKEDANDTVKWSEDNNITINGKTDKGDDYIFAKC